LVVPVTCQRFQVTLIIIIIAAHSITAIWLWLWYPILGEIERDS